MNAIEDIRQDTSLDWTLYVVRDDGDGDRVAVFTAEADRTVTCEVNEREESLAYHLCHEIAAHMQSDLHEQTVMLPSKAFEPSVEVEGVSVGKNALDDMPSVWENAGELDAEPKTAPAWLTDQTHLTQRHSAPGLRGM